MAEAEELVYTPANEDFIVLIDWPGAQAGVVKASRGERLEATQEQSQKALNYAVESNVAGRRIKSDFAFIEIREVASYAHTA